MDQVAPRLLGLVQRATVAVAVEPLASFLATEVMVPTCLIMEATHHSVEVEEPWVATTEAHGLLVKLRQTTRITGHQQVLVLSLIHI